MSEQSPSTEADGRPVPTSRLHPAAALPKAIELIRAFLFQSAAMVALLAQFVDSPFQAIVLVLLLVFLIGVWYWLRFRYHVSDDALHVVHGIIERQQVFLPFERVQAVDLSAGPIHRVLGLVRVAVKTGAAGTQVDLLAVSRAEGERIARLARAAAGASSAAGTGAAAEPGRSGLSPGRYLLLGATSGRLWVALMATLAFGMEIVEELVDFEVIEAQVVSLVSSVSSGGSEIHVAALGVVVCVLLPLFFWLASTGEVLVRLGRFEVRRSPEQIRVGRGLVSRKEVTLPADRIQAVRLVESAGMLAAGYVAVYAEAVGHLEERRESTCLHPALRRDELGAFLRELLPEFDAETEWVGPPSRARVRFVWKPVALLVGLSIAAFFWEPLLGIALLLAVPLAIVAMLRAFRDTGLGYASDLVLLRSRWLGRVSVVVPRRRIQAASTRANIFQRRQSLASARVVVASGPLGRTFTARDLDEKVASELLSWMGPRPTGAV